MPGRSSLFRKASRLFKPHHGDRDNEEMTWKISNRLSRRQSQITETLAIPKADLPKKRPEREKVKAEEVRELCELIRRRYTLDLSLWDLRHARERDRPPILDEVQKAEATLAKIRRILHSWDGADLFDSKKDWVKVQEIKRRVGLEGKRNWVNNPPWTGNDEKDEDLY